MQICNMIFDLIGINMYLVHKLAVRAQNPIRCGTAAFPVKIRDVTACKNGNER